MLAMQTVVNWDVALVVSMVETSVMQMVVMMAASMVETSEIRTAGLKDHSLAAPMVDSTVFRSVDLLESH